MNQNCPPVPGTPTTAVNPGPRRRLGSLFPLVLLAGAMEILYLCILRLSNLKEHVETFILLVLLQGILYFVSVHLGEKIFPRSSHLVLIFVAAAAFRLTLFPLYPSLSATPTAIAGKGKRSRPATTLIRFGPPIQDCLSSVMKPIRL